MIDRARPAKRLAASRRVVGEVPVMVQEGPAGSAVLTEPESHAVLWPRPGPKSEPTTRWVRLGHEGGAVFVGWHPWVCPLAARYPVVRLVDQGAAGVRIVQLGPHTLAEAVGMLGARPAAAIVRSPRPAAARSRARELAEEGIALAVGTAALFGAAGAVTWLAVARAQGLV
jgi:hypothetical protein